MGLVSTPEGKQTRNRQKITGSGNEYIPKFLFASVSRSTAMPHRGRIFLCGGPPRSRAAASLFLLDSDNIYVVLCLFPLHIALSDMLLLSLWAPVPEDFCMLISRIIIRLRLPTGRPHLIVANRNSKPNRSAVVLYGCIGYLPACYSLEKQSSSYCNLWLSNLLSRPYRLIIQDFHKQIAAADIWALRFRVIEIALTK